MPICFTAHENGLVKFWDLNSGAAFSLCPRGPGQGTVGGRIGGGWADRLLARATGALSLGESARPTGRAHIGRRKWLLWRAVPELCVCLATPRGIT